jgi:hypothetical protein
MIDTFGSTKIFERYLTPEKLVAYYPSAGFYDQRILSFPFDVMILSDYVDSQSVSEWKGHICSNASTIRSFFMKYEIKVRNFIEFETDPSLSYGVFERNNKIFIYFFEDNNHTQRRILEANIKLDGLITINDGCMEGGNYECINREEWIDRIRPALKEDAVHARDHSDRNMGGHELIGGDSPKGLKIREAIKLLYPQFNN